MTTLAPIPPDHWILTTPMVVLDVESTGLDPEADRVVQIAMLQIDGGEITDEYSVLVDPCGPIPAEASAIHGVTSERLATEGALAFVMHSREIARRAARRVVVGYNAARFDLPIVRAELARCRIPTGGRTPLDVLSWVRKLDRYVPGPGRHRLHETARRHGLSIEGAEHDARTDARATWALMRRLVEEHPREFRGTLAEVLDRQRRLDVMHEGSHAARTSDGGAVTADGPSDRDRPPVRETERPDRESEAWLRTADRNRDAYLTTLDWDRRDDADA